MAQPLVLILDPSEVRTQLLKRMLGQLNIQQVYCTKAIDEAFHLWSVYGFDIVFADYIFLRQNRQLLERLNTIPSIRQTTLILLVTHTTSNTLRELTSLGATSLLVRPFNIHGVYRVLPSKYKLRG